MTTLSIPRTGFALPAVVEQEIIAAPLPLITAQRPSLHGLLRSLQRHLPAQMAVLGVCEDQTPVLFDLTDPRPANLLICSDQADANLMLMQTMLHSALTFSAPDEVQFIVLANDPSRWETFRKAGESTGHSLGVMGAYEDRAGQHLLDLAETVDQRRMGRQSGPALLVLIDDLRWPARMDFDIRLNFEWLLGAAAQVNVWPVAAISSADLTSLGSLVHKFKTRITGHISDPRLGCRAAGSDGLRTDELASDEFLVKAGGEWLRFATPQMD